MTGVAIRDYGASIQILLNDSSFLITKQQIAAIDTISNESVRIDIGEGPLRNIYIKHSDVIEPKTGSVLELRDFINSLLPTTGKVAITDTTTLEQYKVLVEIRDAILKILDYVNSIKKA
jgi:hypothetical protein